MAETTRAVLEKRLERLSPLERSILQVLAVADEPLNQTVLLGLCTRAGIPTHDPAPINRSPPCLPKCAACATWA